MLARYVGWGGLPQAFDHQNPEWSDEYRELAQVLPQDEYTKARRSTQDAHYTSPLVIASIYEALDRMGFSGGKILEPSSGIGHFIGAAPEAVRAQSTYTAIELDPTSAAIGKHLYPSTTTINKGLHEVALPAAYFDACIGNPPFGSQTLTDPLHPHLSRFSIHNYFVAKSVDALRPGGLLALVISRYFLDATDDRARSYIANRAQFLGAIRLPNTAFRRNALTDVTTDLVYFRKYLPGEPVDNTWIGTGVIRDEETGQPITIGQYYLDYPEQMAGTMVLSNKMHAGSADLLPFPGSSLREAIAVRTLALPTNIYTPNEAGPSLNPPQDDTPPVSLPDSIKVGAFFLTTEGRLATRLPDILGESRYHLSDVRTLRAEARIRGMMRIRDSLRALMAEERQASADGHQLAQLRGTLNNDYDTFVRRHGHINSVSNRSAMLPDPDYPLLSALEVDYDRGVSPETARRNRTNARPPTAHKAPIFMRRVIAPIKRIEHAATAQDALVVSLNETGRVDMQRMVALTGRTERQLRDELKGRIFHCPATERWLPADQYLTGNVKRALKIARSYAEADPQYQENVDALIPVQPPDIEPIDISVQLGSTWVSQKYVSAFVTHLIGDVHRRIDYNAALGKWLVKIHEGGADPVLTRTTWGTQDYPANELITAILTNRIIRVQVEAGQDENGRPRYVTDQQKTAAANSKADEVRAEFQDWIWSDKERREDLSRIYNTSFNTNVPKRFDGSHLTLPGASPDIQLRPTQLNAIWRGVQEGGGLLDHVVGAGKTLTCVGIAMESRRMGLLRKPLFVVPNHLPLQWRDAFYSLYPSANILVAEPSDFEKRNRERLFSRIATGDWDAVIIGHSSFKKIGMPPETLQEMLDEQVNDLTRAIAGMKEANGDRMTIKQLEKTKERMNSRLQRKADTGSKDRAVTFDELGVDAIFVDESQEFKNLYITTTLSSVAGLGQLDGSDKAFDLFVKARYLQSLHGGDRGLFFATGTPISNTIAEVFTIQRYLQYNDLKLRGLHHFDAWASVFGRIVTGWELDSTGVNYKLNSRFSRFQNVPELATLYRDFADVVSLDDLHRYAEQQGARFPVPNIHTGKPEQTIVERSEAQARYIGVLEAAQYNGEDLKDSNGIAIKRWNEGSIIHRMENLPKDPREDNPLKITNDARKAGLDFRLIDPRAADLPGSKLNTAVENIYLIWDKWRSRKGTQLVFCDLSTPKSLPGASPENRTSPTQPQDPDPTDAEDGEQAETEVLFDMDELLAASSTFDVYNDIRNKLITKGVPSDEIRFIHEAKTPAQKAKLFQAMNRGDVRVLIGSTSKLGAGTNVQKKLVALHDLDVPWRPTDLQQRMGRIVRQGNTFYDDDPVGFTVQVIRYATRQTYDARSWQTIEFKAAAIEQFRKADALQRVMDDIAGEAATAADMKAAASGNQLILLQVQVAAELRKCEALFANNKRNKHALESRVGFLEAAEYRAERRTKSLREDIARRDTATRDNKLAVVMSDGMKIAAENREALQPVILLAMKRAIETGSKTYIGRYTVQPVFEYRGFPISVFCRAEQLQFRVQAGRPHDPDNLTFGAGDRVNVSGLLKRIDNYLASFEETLHWVERDLQREIQERESAKLELKKPFPQHRQLQQLRQDARDVITELKLMQDDPEYKSTWTPKGLGTDQPQNVSESHRQHG